MKKKKIIVEIFSKRKDAYGWMQKESKLGWIGGSGIIEDSLHHKDANGQEINEK